MVLKHLNIKISNKIAQKRNWSNNRLFLGIEPTLNLNRYGL